MTLLIGALTLGTILALLAIGVYVSFRIFAIADITVDGSLTLGDAFVPWYRATPIYIDRVNRHPRPPPGRKPVPRVPSGPVMGPSLPPTETTVTPKARARRSVSSSIMATVSAGSRRATWASSWAHSATCCSSSSSSRARVGRQTSGRKTPTKGRLR